MLSELWLDLQDPKTKPLTVDERAEGSFREMGLKPFSTLLSPRKQALETNDSHAPAQAS